MPLTGPDAPIPITAEQISTLNCWPTPPQSNELAEVFAFNTPASRDSGSFLDALMGITLVTIVWATGDKTELEVPRTEPVLVSVHDAGTQKENSEVGV